MAHIKKNILKNQNKNKYNDYVKMNPAYLMPVNYKLKMVNFMWFMLLLLLLLSHFSRVQLYATP